MYMVDPTYYKVHTNYTGGYIQCVNKFSLLKQQQQQQYMMCIKQQV